MIGSKPFILASSSPRRKILLNQIGLDFSIVNSQVIENLNIKFPPEAMAEHWAREKAIKISEKYPDILVVGADTIINFEDNILGKPKDKVESYKMLKRLSGKKHEVITGVSFIHLAKGLDITFNEITCVSLRILTDEEIYFYIDNYNTLDKAGSYGIQDFFSVHVVKIEGCYFNVMGLPLSSFYTYLKSI